jgi:predicted  nucleic acid-binding Zn-ribbon protein
MGVAAIKDSSCSGCFVVLTPHQVIAIGRGLEMALCPRCQRILYSKEAVAKYEAEQPTAT